MTLLDAHPLASPPRSSPCLSPSPPPSYLVYSTCTFSPVEGEAVVASALRSPDGEGVELVEINGALLGIVMDAASPP